MKLVRIQRRRTKGWRLPENTVCVDRSTKWGNPFKVNNKPDSMGIVMSPEFCIKMYEQFLIWDAPYDEEDIKKELKGKNLACFCPLDQPCHADVLLEIANR